VFNSKLQALETNAIYDQGFFVNIYFRKMQTIIYLILLYLLYIYMYCELSEKIHEYVMKKMARNKAVHEQ
jgi:hypothetical protein